MVSFDGVKLRKFNCLITSPTSRIRIINTGERKSSSPVGGVAERGGCPGETAPGAASPLIDVEALSDASRSPPPEPPPAATPVPGQCAATAETV